MKVLVAVKRVVDPNVTIRLKPDGSGVDLAGAKMVMNPFDEIAIEEAVRLREVGEAQEVVAVSVGPGETVETLRTALAMGADRARLIRTDTLIEPLGVSKVLKALIDDEAPDLVFLGKQAIDDDMNATGQMLAALLDWPQATFASEIVVKEGAIEVAREVDGGTQTVVLKLPAVVTTDLRLNTPRYASLPNIMKAKRKPVDEITPDALNADVEPRLTVLAVKDAPRRVGGRKVGSTAELVSALRTEAGAL